MDSESMASFGTSTTFVTRTGAHVNSVSGGTATTTTMARTTASESDRLLCDGNGYGDCRSTKASGSVTVVLDVGEGPEKYSVVSGMGGSALQLVREVLLSTNMPASKEAVKSAIRHRKGWPVYPLCIVETTLRGVSQVYLMDHPVTGLLILGGIMWSGVYVALGALLGALCSTLGAVAALRGFTDDIFDGLYGYDGALAGAAIIHFVELSYRPWAVVLAVMLVAFWCGVVRVGLVPLLRRAQLPVLTISFNLTTTTLLLLLNGMSSAVQLKTPVANPPAERNMVMVLEGALKGIGQFIFAGSYEGSAMVLLALLVCKRRDAFGAVVGSLVATLMATFVLNVNSTLLADVQQGLWSYNGMGCGAVFASGLFAKRTKYNAVFGAFASAATVMVESTLRRWLSPAPILTFAFVLTTWAHLLARFAGEEARQRGNSVKITFDETVEDS